MLGCLDSFVLVLMLLLPSLSISFLIIIHLMKKNLYLLTTITQFLVHFELTQSCTCCTGIVLLVTVLPFSIFYFPLKS